jgi:hypothetical protein
MSFEPFGCAFYCHVHAVSLLLKSETNAHTPFRNKLSLDSDSDSEEYLESDFDGAHGDESDEGHDDGQSEKRTGRKREAAERKHIAEGGAAPKKQKRNQAQHREKESAAAASSEMEDSDGGCDSSSDEDGSKGKDLVGCCFEDEGMRCEVTAFGVDDGRRVLFYTLPGGEEVFSQVSEVRKWVQNRINREISPGF